MSHIDGQGSPAYRIYVLSVIVSCYTVTSLGRVLAGVAMPQIRAELNLTDSQIGVITGAAFAVTSLMFGFVFGWLADHRNRVRILALAMALCSLATAAFGVSKSFATLALGQAGLGVSEPGSPMQSLLMDYFPRSQHGRVMGIYTYGYPLSSAAGIVIGAWMISVIGWRSTFLMLGGLALAVALLVLITLREPKRAQVAPTASSVVILQGFRKLFMNPDYLLVAVACGLATVPIMAIIFWMPSLFVRTYGMKVTDFSLVFGLFVLVGGIIGAPLGGYLADRLNLHSSASHNLVAAGSFLFTAPFILATLLASSITTALVCLFAGFLIQSMCGGPAIVSFQRLVAPNLRGIAVAMFHSITSGIGLGIGIPLIGVISDVLHPAYGEFSLRYALLVLPAFYIAAALIFLLVASRVKVQQIYPAAAA